MQAFAQPLLTTIARTVPPERCRWSFETLTAAAITLLVVKTAAACAAASATRSMRSGFPLGLIPALMPAARKPRGVAMPPGMRKGAALIYASGAAAAAGSPYPRSASKAWSSGTTIAY